MTLFKTYLWRLFNLVFRKAYPRHWLDFVLWPFLRIVWEPFSKKQSHWWHWRPYAGDIPEKCFTDFVSNSDAKSGNHGLASLWQRNFGWKTVVMVRVDGGTENSEYLFGFEINEHREICSMVLRNFGAGMLVGPDPVRFFAISCADKKPVSLKIWRRVRKSDVHLYLVPLI
jgi:hypothetical protein